MPLEVKDSKVPAQPHDSMSHICAELSFLQGLSEGLINFYPDLFLA